MYCMMNGLQCKMMNIKTSQGSGSKRQLFLFSRGVLMEKRIQPEAGKIKNSSFIQVLFWVHILPPNTLMGTYPSTQYPHGYITFHPIPSWYISFHPIPSRVHILPPNTLMGTYPSTQYPHWFISFHSKPSWVHNLLLNTLMHGT